MVQQIQISILPEQVHDHELIKKKIRNKFKNASSDFYFKWKKRSIDARNNSIKINATFLVSFNEDELSNKIEYIPKIVANSPSVVIIGSGPAGLFAALRALELGIKPIIYERGKDVKSRRRDLAKINKEGIVNSESNYCFGEGGAGTYSDGKLYTRSKKRGDIQRVLELFVHFGANEDILVDAHPHIGTNKLPDIIESMRSCIIENGGEVHFNSKLTDINFSNEMLTDITINNQVVLCNQLVLATGHSARDVFYLLHKKKIRIESKPFALGVRIEHPQSLIDKIQYHGRLNDDFLPPASYSLVAQIADRGVFSFCMCPGGIIAPCATEQEEVVTNGWSPSKRNNPYSNSGIVISINQSDCKGEKDDPFICLDFQKSIEKKAWELAGKTQRVPAQRLKDFIDGKLSIDFPKTSYHPGLTSVKMDDVFPLFITNKLKKAFLEFDKKMNGFITNDAVLHAPESRTSSPISIPRETDSLQHPDIKGLYPCGEGAGFAGGIVSAAMDGIKVMNAVNVN